MSATVEIFRKYPHHSIFIETGSYIGDGIQLALDAGFLAVVSIELSEELFHQCEERFKDNSNVILLQGDSATVLPKILEDIRFPVTFWLDSHYSGDGTVMGEHYSSLLQELEAIKNHPIKNHIIMIDDVRLWPNWGLNVEMIQQKLLEINPDYKFTFEDGYVPNDILVAVI
jgi:hypothetical protein